MQSNLQNQCNSIKNNMTCFKVIENNQGNLEKKEDDTIFPNFKIYRL